MELHKLSGEAEQHAPNKESNEKNRKMINICEY